MWRSVKLNPGPASLRYRRFAGLAATVALVTAAATGPVRAADRIILRSFKTIDAEIASFDEEGVRLSDQRVVTWDQVERATLSADRQAAFDKMLSDLGEPMFRIRRGLMVGDYRGILSHAKTLYPRYASRRSRAAYFVCQSYMWSLLAHGRREESLEPYLRCLDLLRTANGQNVALPGDRRLKCDPDSGMSAELLPIWFDQQAAREQLAKVRATIRSLRTGRPTGVYIYYATLALTAGDRARAEKVIAACKPQQPRTRGLRQIVVAQLALDAGQPAVAIRQLDGIPAAEAAGLEALILYWRSVAQLAAARTDTERQQAVLALLRLPAMHASSSPDIAAAALAEALHTIQLLKDDTTTNILRQELLDSFPNSYHAGQIAGGKSSTSKD